MARYELFTVAKEGRWRQAGRPGHHQVNSRKDKRFQPEGVKTEKHVDINWN